MVDTMTEDDIIRRQYYVLQTPPVTVPEGYHHLPCGSCHVVVDTEFSVIPVVDDDQQVGLVFGTILDPGGRVRDGRIRLDPDHTAESPLRSFEWALSGLLGRYVGLYDSEAGRHLYTDPIGALPCVYDERRGIVAASPSMMPDTDTGERFREDLFKAVKRPLVGRGANIWLPGSLTYFRGIERLLPNHSLDLETWETRRFWPRESDTGSNPSSAGEIERIIEILSDIFELIVETYTTPTMSLTAGMDSRSLLAVARDPVTRGDISLFTIGDSDRNVDVYTARRITRAHDLDWTALPIVEATEREQARWLRRTGYTVGSAVKETYLSMHSLDTDAEVGGIGGEMGRGYLWKDSDNSENEITSTDILLRYHKPEHPELLETVEEWFHSVTQFDTYTILDLAHQEHRLGCWGGPQHLGFRAGVDHLRPFCYRPVVESMHRLTPEIRRNDQLPRRIIEQCWSELDRRPYNSFTGWRKYWGLLERNASTAKAAVSNPQATLEYLSQRYIRH
jgi:hypothetical protein